MSDVWDQVRVEQYISQAIEENLTLDYKAAGALAKTDGKRAEITKDVSAMANSAGGMLIYGIAEFQDKAREHLPEKIDPIDRTQFSKEWLEHVIGNIQPKIDVIIHPVTISTAPNHVVYVVEIPQSHTAHQAHDKRYYKRFNFESVAMEDYEIRDVMGRRQHARIELEFKILIRTEIEYSPSDMLPSYSPFEKKKEPRKYTVYELKVRMRNIGKVYGQYVEVFIDMPCNFVYDFQESMRKAQGLPDRPIDLNQVCTYTRDNTVRDLIKGGSWMGPAAEYGPARYVPILPGTSLSVDHFPLTRHFETIDWETCSIQWTTHVDNAPPHSGEIAIKDIEIIDRRGKDDDDFDDGDAFE